MDIEKELGTRVKFLRVRKGWTQDQLAEKLGYTSRAMVSKIEKGERGIKASMIPLIADVFDVSVPYLLYGQIDKEEITLEDMELMGHKNFSMTVSYARSDDEKKITAMEENVKGIVYQS